MKAVAYTLSYLPLLKRHTVPSLLANFFIILPKAIALNQTPLYLILFCALALSADQLRSLDDIVLMTANTFDEVGCYINNM